MALHVWFLFFMAATCVLCQQENCKSISCSSKRFRYKICLIDRVRPSLVTSVEVTSNLSRSACTFDKSFGIVDNGIFVDLGCRAVFEVCFLKGGAPSPIPDDQERCRRLDCSSRGFKYEICSLDEDPPVTVTRVEVIERKSRSPCEKGIGFGKKGDGIFVDEGCRATFLVCFKKVSSICPFHPPDECDPEEIFRTYDGTCNNLEVNPLWGSANTPFGRFLPPTYKDGLDAPRDIGSFGNRLPGPRRVSRLVHQASSDSDLLPDVSHLTMVFGQFLAHDLTKNEEYRSDEGTKLECCQSEYGETTYYGDACSLAIRVPNNDPDFDQCLNFVRSVKVPNLECTKGPRQQQNHITSFIDLSSVYGSSEDEAEALRDFDGLMKTSFNDQGDELLPLDFQNEAGCILKDTTQFCFKAGDSRINEHPLLASIHTVFVRLHNNIANDLLINHPDESDDDDTDESDDDDTDESDDYYPDDRNDEVFEATRKILGAVWQHIVYNEFLPLILGDATMDKNNLRSLEDGFLADYDSTLDPSVNNAVAAAAFRFGHSMVPNGINCVHADNTESEVLYSKVFHNPELFYDEDVGIESMTQGFLTSKSQKVDRFFTEELTKHLFETAPGNGGDVVSLNIQRGRDHGIPTYTEWREFCGLSVPEDFTTDANGFEDLPNAVVRKLKELYSDPKDVDLYPAAVSEINVPGGKVGPTFACMLGRQLRALKFGDRFWYENDGPQEFTKDQLNEIRKATMSGILCDTTQVELIQPNAFQTSTVAGNEPVPCSVIPVMDISLF